MSPSHHHIRSSSWSTSTIRCRHPPPLPPHLPFLTVLAQIWPHRRTLTNGPHNGHLLLPCLRYREPHVPLRLCCIHHQKNCWMCKLRSPPNSHLPVWSTLCFISLTHDTQMVYVLINHQTQLKLHSYECIFFKLLYSVLKYVWQIVKS